VDLRGRECVIELESRPNADPVEILARTYDDDGGIVRIKPSNRREVTSEQSGDFLADGGEELARTFSSCDKRRYAPQRGLFLGEPFEVSARFRVRNHRREQLREVGDPRFNGSTVTAPSVIVFPRRVERIA
jgi:hypothetical protein